MNRQALQTVWMQDRNGRRYAVARFVEMRTVPALGKEQAQPVQTWELEDGSIATINPQTREFDFGDGVVLRPLDR